MIFSDLVALAKAGYSPKQVKELLEMVETSPKVKETSIDEAKKLEKEQPKEQPKEEESKQEDEDPVQTLLNILKEDK
jgi:DNA-binding transcriptional MerR regulator